MYHLATYLKPFIQDSRKYFSFFFFRSSIKDYKNEVVFHKKGHRKTFNNIHQGFINSVDLCYNLEIRRWFHWPEMWDCHPAMLGACVSERTDQSRITTLPRIIDPDDPGGNWIVTQTGGNNKCCLEWGCVKLSHLALQQLITKSGKEITVSIGRAASRLALFILEHWLSYHKISWLKENKDIELLM